MTTAGCRSAAAIVPQRVEAIVFAMEIGLLIEGGCGHADGWVGSSIDLIGFSITGDASLADGDIARLGPLRWDVDA